MLIATINQLKANNAIFVGDSEIDAKAAQCANLPFILFTQGYLKLAKEQVHFRAKFYDYAQLPKIIEQIDK